MKITVVPAQVTTVEDRVAGNLGFSQLALFALPVFGGALLYAVLPPSMEYSLYKIIVVVVVAIVSGILAIRIKGKIILLWLVVLARYNLRPKLYLFNKNISCYREDYPEPIKVPIPKPNVAKLRSLTVLPKLASHEQARLYVALDNPVSRLCFETNKKGGLNVRITEVQD
jgi:hypothetical protein